MEKLIIKKSKVKGILDIVAAKNAVLPILACCILIEDTVVIHNTTPLSDIKKMCEIITSIGGSAKFDGNDLIVDCKGVCRGDIDGALTKDMRASI
ncbi:MAG: UDP-N-acetylglucosamine 1-carboxyvinyltransferase, partial [Firmicutes bacterium]|nr:UDP-N-acetylglucosamine 1-carboxyvinyltransferase [Bacillota bacterium]